ncbi:MAG: hypothetical protein IJH50_05660 [Kiritimatiellae bacterium]|nr:hypothetical protein [Kiritimatiellia bacterium]
MLQVVVLAALTLFDFESPEGLVRSMTDYTSDPAAIIAWRDAMADLIEVSSTTENMERTK